MEGSNGHDVSPVEKSNLPINFSIPHLGEGITISKLKQPTPAANIFRVLSDPSALSLIKDTSCGSSGSNHDVSSDMSKMDEDSYDSASAYSANGDSSMHLDSLNTEEVRAYECDECGKAFKRSEHLRKHKTTHTGIKPYECDQCDKKYTQSSSLKIHKMSHSNVQSFPCDMCPRSFTQASSLNLHKKIHLFNKMYNCPICGKGYNHSANLAVHQRTHSEKFKFFSCDTCGKQFTQKGNLNTHKMIHDNIRPYKCGICGKEFVQKNNYLLHLKTHEKYSTSGHVAVPKKITSSTTFSKTAFHPVLPESSEGKEENDEDDDTYLDDFVIGTMPASENVVQPVVTSTPEKSNNEDKKESPETSKVTITKVVSKKCKSFKSIVASVPFVCMDCNNKPFSEKCRLSDHKMYVLF